MAKIVDPEVWIGRTRNKAWFRVYVLGKRANGASSVWILGSAEARLGGLPGFAAQRTGFPNEGTAEEFARRVFGPPGRLAEFVSHDLNPLSVERADAPIFVYKVPLGSERAAAHADPIGVYEQAPPVSSAAVGGESTVDSTGFEQIHELNNIFGVAFDNVSVGPNEFGDWIATGEIRTQNGGAPEKAFRILGSAIDDRERIVGAGYCDVKKGGFFGLLAFEMHLGKPPEGSTIPRFRIFPEAL